MSFEYSPYILSLTAAALVSGWALFYIWPHRETKNITMLIFLAAGVAIWTFGYALEIAGADLATKLFWGKFQYFGIATIPVAWLFFAFTYTNQSFQLTRRMVISLTIIPLVTLLLTFTTELHGLVWWEYSIFREGDFSALQLTHGVWFWVYWAYSQLLLLAGTTIVVRSLVRARGVFRGQRMLFFIAVLAPWIGNALYVTGNSPIPHLDLTPFAFTVSVAALVWAIFGFRLVDITPFARDRVVDSMRDGMIVLDVHGNIVDINDAAARMIGVPVAGVIGKTAADVFSPWSHLIERFRNVMEAIEEISVGEGETERRFEVRISQLQDQQGHFVGRVIMLRTMDEEALKQERDLLERLVEKELAERERAQVLLQESEARFRQIVENASDIIYRTDMSGNFTYANPAALKMMGYASEQEMLDRNYLDIITPEFRHKIKRFYDHQTMGKIKSSYYEFPVVTMNGHIAWLGQSVQLIMDGERVVGFQAVSRDITQLKQALEALALSRDQATDASRFKTQLLTRVSHELRTPLGGILGYAELLEYKVFGPLTEKQHDAVNNIIESTNYLTGIVNNLLDVSQIESKSLSLHNDYFTPVDLLEKTKGTLSALANKKGLGFCVEISPDLPGELYGDVNHLQQVVINLAGNAIKFTKVGEVSVCFKRPAPAHWSIEVRDTGAGISHSEHEFIFEPFRQVNNSITSENRGSGLGLAITKQLVEIMGGQISLESEIGKGSLFTVTLPITNAPGE